MTKLSGPDDIAWNAMSGAVLGMGGGHRIAQEVVNRMGADPLTPSFARRASRIRAAGSTLGALGLGVVGAGVGVRA
jgi:hypothetical protein